MKNLVPVIRELAVLCDLSTMCIERLNAMCQRLAYEEDVLGVISGHLYRYRKQDMEKTSCRRWGGASN
jgi:hypothetical protein